MTVFYPYNDAIFTRSHIVIPNYSDGLYPETTDVYDIGAGPFISFVMSGPVDLTFRSYGGFCGYWLDGVDMLVSIGPSTPGYADLFLTPVSVPGGSHTITFQNFGTGFGSTNFAFAGMLADVSGSPPTFYSFAAQGHATPPFGLLAWQAAVDGRVADDVLCAYVGNSVTEGQGASDYAHAWVSRLNVGLNEYDGSYFTPTNDGISGAKVSDILSGGYVAALDTATALVTVELGINDCYNGVTVPTYTTNLGTLVDSITARCPDASVLIIGAHLIETIDEADWDDFLAAMVAVASAKGTAYLDMAVIFGDPFTNGLLADGVHPNDAGHKVYADTLFRFLT